MLEGLVVQRTISLSVLFATMGMTRGDEVTNHFSAQANNVPCEVQVYAGPEKLEFAGWLTELPKTEYSWVPAMLLTHSNAASLMTNDEIRGLMEKPGTDEEISKRKAGLAKMYELAKPDAADNPWKGMKSRVERVLLIDCSHGRYLLYIIGSNNGGGTATGSLKWISGKWRNPVLQTVESGMPIGDLAKLDKEYERLLGENRITAEPFAAMPKE